MYQTLNNKSSNETIIFDSLSMYFPTSNNGVLIYQIFRGIILYFLTFWTIIGNIFILIAISTNRKLKKNGTSNILIGNLAFSDLLLGLTVLPFSATADTLQKWIFGEILCEIWLSVDVLCCTASIWGLLMIAIDRYIATIYPIKYRQLKINPNIAIIYISTSWLISLLISLGPIFIYNTDLNSALNNYTIMGQLKPKRQSSLKLVEGTTDYVCFLFNKVSYVIFSSIGSFYLPLLFMIILYSRVIQKIHKIKQFRQPNSLKYIVLKYRNNEAALLNLNEQNEDKKQNGLKKTRTITIDDKKNEARTSKILLIIMASFVACWLPFFIVNIYILF